MRQNFESLENAIEELQYKIDTQGGIIIAMIIIMTCILLSLAFIIGS